MREGVSRGTAGLMLGPVLFFSILYYPGLPWEARAVAASVAWIATWWLTEAIPIPATSLLPVVLFPLLGVMEVGEVTAEYGNQIIFLFIGGFFIAIAMEKWGLHRRIALFIVGFMGTSLRRIVAGFMLATAFLSAWISNTATTMMMVPIATAVIRSREREDRNFNRLLVLAIAYSASIGGVATLIGTPPNLIFSGIYGQLFQEEITFVEWTAFALPLSLVLLFIAWAYLSYFACPPESRALGESIKEKAESLGRITGEERKVLGVFLLVALLWVTRVLWGDYLPLVKDSTVAIGGAVLLFLMPARGGNLLEWEDAKRVPWGIVLLFGGGLAIAKGFSSTGLDTWVAERLLFLEALPLGLILLGAAALVLFLTEITSNTATATIFLPIMASMAGALGVEPLGLMVAATMASSLAFMMPVATPPNAIVFGTGYVGIPQMARAGMGMNLISLSAIALYVYLLF